MSCTSALKILYRRIEEDLVFMRASSLTYQSFLSIVPILAIMFGIAKGFGIDAVLEIFLRKELADHAEILEYFLTFSRTTLQQAQGSVIAGTGIAVLLFTTVRLFWVVEGTFNAMWGISACRRYTYRAISYIALITICPLLLVLASSMTIFLTTTLSTLLSSDSFSTFGTIIRHSISLIPLVTLTTLFSLLLYLIPSAKVSFRSACMSGSCSAIVFYLVQMWYIQFQLKLTQLSTIYGSFVALPLFLAWLWISWCIFLLSGELCVACEEKLWRYSSHELQTHPRACDIALLNAIVYYYEQGQPASVPLLHKKLKLPLRQLYTSLEKLRSRSLIYEADYIFSHNLAFVPSLAAFSYSLSSILLEAPADDKHTYRPSLTPPHTASHDIIAACRRLSYVASVLDDLPDHTVISSSNPLVHFDSEKLQGSEYTQNR